jgi:hypothetical protein
MCCINFSKMRECRSLHIYHFHFLSQLCKKSGAWLWWSHVFCHEFVSHIHPVQLKNKPWRTERHKRLAIILQLQPNIEFRITDNINVSIIGYVSLKCAIQRIFRLSNLIQRIVITDGVKVRVQEYIATKNCLCIYSQNSPNFNIVSIEFMINFSTFLLIGIGFYLKEY